MGGCEHASERGEVLPAGQVEIFKHEVGAPGGDPVGMGLGRAHSARAQRCQPVGFGCKRVLVFGRIGLQEAGRARDAHRIAVMDAATRDADNAFNPEFSPK